MVSAVVIDDDRDITEVFSELLNLHGIDVLDSGYDGEDAVVLVEKHQPDMVFLDVHMPRRDGIQALREIKKKSLPTKIVMVTGDLSKDLEKLLQEMGAAAIIFKPFNMEKIIQVLQDLEKATDIIIQKSSSFTNS